MKKNMTYGKKVISIVMSMAVLAVSVSDLVFEVKASEALYEEPVGTDIEEDISEILSNEKQTDAHETEGTAREEYDNSSEADDDFGDIIDENERDEYRIVELPMGKILQEGYYGYPDDQEAELVGGEVSANYVESEVKNFLYKKLKKRERRISLDGFIIPECDIESLVNQTLSEHEELYAVRRRQYAVDDEGRVVKLYIKYDLSLEDGKFEKAVRLALSGITEDMSEMEKALVIHDYIVVNCEYAVDEYNRKAIQDVRYSAYGALVEHMAVCAGYAAAYTYLCKKAGLDCHSVSSLSMNHGWNLVSVDGHYYHVDCTWDDNTSGVNERGGGSNYGEVGHTHFLRNDLTFEESHTIEEVGRDWGTDAGTIIADSDLYENAWFRYAYSPVVIHNNKYYFGCWWIPLDVYGSRSSTKLKISYVPRGSINDYSEVSIYNSEKFYCSGLFMIDGLLYFNEADSIFSINPDGTDIQTVYTRGESDKKIYHCFYDGVRTAFSDEDDHIEYVDYASVNNRIKDVLFSDNELYLNKGDGYSLGFYVYSGSVSENDFEISSSDPSIVKVVGDNGERSQIYLKAIDEGDARITAIYGDTAIVCHVKVTSELPWTEFFEYSTAIGSDKLTLYNYVGRVRDVKIHKNAVIDGREYNVCVEPGCFYKSEIESVQVEEGVVFNDCKNMFYMCSELRTVSMNGADTSKVKSMESMFYGCNSLESVDFTGVDLSAVIKSDSAFIGCTSFRELYTPGLVPDVSISLPCYMNPWEDGADSLIMFSYLNGITGNTRLIRNKISDYSPFWSGSEGRIRLTKYIGRETEIEIPGKVNIEGGDCTVVIDGGIFQNNCDILSVVIGNGAVVGNGIVELFSGCSNLKRIDMSGLNSTSMNHIVSAFKGCTSLEELDMSGMDLSDVKSYDGFLSDCTSLQIFKTPVNAHCENTPSFTNLPYVMMDDSGLRYAYLPEDKEYSFTLTAPMEGSAGEGIRWVWKDGVLTISGNGAMEDFDSSTEVVWGSCRQKTKKITIGEGVTSIGSFAFSKFNWINGRDVEMPHSLTRISNAAFKDCDSISEFIIPEGIKKLGSSLFSWNDTLEHIVVPMSVTSVGRKAFFGCPQIKTAGPLGSGCALEFGWIYEIPSYAFYGSHLESIRIPDSLEDADTIGNHAIEQCNQLKCIYFDGIESQWNEIANITNNPAADEVSVIFGKFRVTFDAREGRSKVKYLDVISGNTADRPEAEREGYSLAGWYKDETLTEEYDFNSPVFRDMTLYAGYVRSVSNSSSAKEGIVSTSSKESSSTKTEADGSTAKENISSGSGSSSNKTSGNTDTTWKSSSSGSGSGKDISGGKADSTSVKDSISSGSGSSSNKTSSNTDTTWKSSSSESESGKDISGGETDSTSVKDSSSSENKPDSHKSDKDSSTSDAASDIVKEDSETGSSMLSGDSSSDYKDSSSSSMKGNYSSTVLRTKMNKVPLNGVNAMYASARDNFGASSPLGAINKQELDFMMVKGSGVDPEGLVITTVKGSRYTVRSGVKSASGEGSKRIIVKVKGGMAVITPKASGKVIITMEDGSSYCIQFFVEMPKAKRTEKKISIGTDIVTKDLKQLFGIERLDGGKLTAVSKMGQALVSDNRLIVTPKQKDTIKVTYEFVNKRYKTTLRVK